MKSCSFVKMLCCASLLSALPVLAPTPAAAIDATMIDAAKKEGQVVWYTTLIVDQMVRPMIDIFEKKYPGVKVKYVRANTEELILKAMNESKANRVEVDVVDGSNVSTTLLKEGLARISHRF